MHFYIEINSALLTVTDTHATMLTKKQKLLAAVVLSGTANSLILATAQPCLAQSAFDHAGSPQGNAPMLPGATSVPCLQGATMGTIGPPGGDASVITGIDVTQFSSTANNSFDLPPFLLADPTVALALFLLIRRKRTSMWEMGIVTSVILGISGFVCASVMFH